MYIVSDGQYRRPIAIVAIAATSQNDSRLSIIVVVVTSQIDGRPSDQGSN